MVNLWSARSWVPAAQEEGCNLHSACSWAWSALGLLASSWDQHFPSSSHLKPLLTSLSLCDIRRETFSNRRGLFRFSLPMEDGIWSPSPPRVPTPAHFFVPPVCFSPLKVFIKMQELLLEGPTYSRCCGAAASEVSEAIHKRCFFHTITIGKCQKSQAAAIRGRV